jgi:hypothetical protein
LVAHAMLCRKTRPATADDRHFKRHFAAAAGMVTWSRRRRFLTPRETRRGAAGVPTLTVAMKPEVEQEPISDR